MFLHGIWLLKRRASPSPSRCIQSRAYFTERFFGWVLDSPSLRSNSLVDHDTVQKRYGLYPFCPPFSRSAHQRWRQDFGHKTFWQSLKKQVDDIEELLEDVERRAYELLLASQNALWVLDQKYEQEGEQCGAYDDESFPKLQKTPPACAANVVPDQNHKPATIALEDIEDPIDVAIQEKRVELWEMIWTRLARYCAPTRSRYYKERLAVIWACVCRAVWTDPSLMLVAQNYRSAKSLLKDSKLDLPTVERLWNAIKQLYVDDVRAAIGDVLHPTRPKGEICRRAWNARTQRTGRSIAPVSCLGPYDGHFAMLFMCSESL